MQSTDSIQISPALHQLHLCVCMCILFYAALSHGYIHVTTATVNILNSPSLHKGPMLPFHSHSHPPPDVTSDPWALELFWLPSLQGLPPASPPPLHFPTDRRTVNGQERQATAVGPLALPLGKSISHSEPQSQSVKRALS